jgi:hypothetical protein
MPAVSLHALGHSQRNSAAARAHHADTAGAQDRDTGEGDEQPTVVH